MRTVRKIIGVTAGGVAIPVLAAFVVSSAGRPDLGVGRDRPNRAAARAALLTEPAGMLAVPPVSCSHLTMSRWRDWEFRPSNDRNFEGELDRMRAVAGGGTTSKQPADYRLGKNFCFIKFCEAETADISSTQLTKGMTLPLDLWDSLITAGELNGPKIGTVLRYDNARRWLSNTMFIDLVDRSWLGTSGISTRRVATYVKKALGDGYVVMMAAGRTRT